MSFYGKDLISEKNAPLFLEGTYVWDWEPLCYSQIGGLSVATFITLILVPVIYAIFVLDLKIVKWETIHVDSHQTIDAAIKPDNSHTMNNY